jgi:hypothetical protein
MRKIIPKLTYLMFLMLSQEYSTIAKESAGSDLNFYFSNLREVKPLVCNYPSGISFEAPKFDSRNFYPPEYLSKQFCQCEKLETAPIQFIKSPEKPYEVLGIISINLVFYGANSIPHDYSIEIINKGLAPNNKKWIDFIEKPSWKNAFKELRTKAEALEANAVIEIFCGSGIPYYTGEYDSYFEQFDVKSESIKRDLLISGYIMMGIAVKWKNGK